MVKFVYQMAEFNRANRNPCVGNSFMNLQLQNSFVNTEMLTLNMHTGDLYFHLFYIWPQTTIINPNATSLTNT